MIKRITGEAELVNTTVTVFPRHIEYLRKLKREQAQGVSDTIRRALDEYMKANPLPDTEKR